MKYAVVDNNGMIRAWGNCEDGLEPENAIAYNGTGYDYYLNGQFVPRPKNPTTYTLGNLSLTLNNIPIGSTVDIVTDNKLGDISFTADSPSMTKTFSEKCMCIIRITSFPALPATFAVEIAAQ